MTFLPNQTVNMSAGLLLDPVPSSSESESPNSGPRFRPYSTPNQHVTKGRYITSNDPRGYIPVYEYPLNGQWIMLDMDDGYVLWTGIWKALGNSKADIVKMIESQPDLASKLRRVRGGYLKIQGTWMPYEIALRLARRVAWPIRNELIPLFGPTFPETCLSPDQPGYGQVVSPGTGRRRARRTYASHATLPDPQHEWSISSSAAAPRPSLNYTSNVSGPSSSFQSRRPSVHLQEHSLPQTNESSVQLHMPYSSQPSVPSSTAGSQHAAGPSRVSQPSPLPTSRHRYSPYQSAPYPSSVPAAPTTTHPAAQSNFDEGQNIRLAPIRELGDSRNERRNSAVKLPPISTLDGFRQGSCGDSAAVLRRLQTPDDPCPVHPELSPHPRDTAHQHTLGLSPTHPHYSNLTARLPTVGCDTRSTLRPSGPRHHAFDSIASPPCRSPTASSVYQGGSTINSPSSASVATPLSARVALDEARVDCSPLPIADQRLLTCTSGLPLKHMN